MAVRAILVPVVSRRRPMELVARLDVLAGMQMVPATATALFWARVVREGERLEMAVSNVDQILLKRFDTERILHVVRLLADLASQWSARDALGLHFVASIAMPKARRLSEVLENPVAKITEYRPF